MNFNLVLKYISLFYIYKCMEFSLKMDQKSIFWIFTTPYWSGSLLVWVPPGLGPSWSGCLLVWVPPGLGPSWSGYILVWVPPGLGLSWSGALLVWVPPSLGPWSGFLLVWLPPGLVPSWSGSLLVWVFPGLGPYSAFQWSFLGGVSFFYGWGVLTPFFYFGNILVMVKLGYTQILAF